MESRQRNDLDAEKLSLYYTDTEDLLNHLQNLASNDSKLEKPVFIIHGIGGAGKSSVLRIFRLFCKKNNIPVALANAEELKQTISFLNRFYTDLKRDNVNLSAFEKNFKKYQDTAQKIGKKIDLEARQQRNESITELGGTGVEMLATLTPVAPLAGGLGTISKVLSGYLLNFLPDYPEKEKDIDLYVKATEQLTNNFIDDLKQLRRKQRVVLILDTYEQIRELDDWVSYWVRELPPYVLVLIAGRMTPNVMFEKPAWRNLRLRIQSQELEPMQEGDVQILIRRYYQFLHGDDPTPEEITRIVDFARGWPLAVTTAVDFWEYGRSFDPHQEPGALDTLVKRQGIPQELSSVIDAAAIVRQFNKELLAFLASSSYVDKFYDKVRHFSFIRSQFGGYAMHDSLRKIMIDKLRIDTPQHYQELHQKAAQYYEQQLQRLEQENPDNIDDRQRFALERIYHLFQISEKQGILYFRQIFENYFSKRQFDFCQALLNELNNYQVTDKTQQWIQYYKGRMAIYMGETPGQPVGILKARNVLEKLNDDATLDRELRINVLENLASIYWYYSLQENTGTEKAERFYQECLKLRSATPDDAAGTARILIWLGILHQRTEGKGEQYFQKAKKLGVGIENVIAQAERELSISCRMQGRFRESQSLIRSSLETFDKLQLYYEKANSLMNYAKLLVDIGQINEAEAIFNQSIKIFQQGQPRFQERPWPLIGLADVALDRGDYRQALTYYNEIEMICQSYPEDKFWQAMITGGRAEIYCQQENWQLALNLANESLNLREEIEDKFGLGWILDTKGRALFGQGLYQEALDSFVEGLRHMEDYGSFFGQSKLSLSICQVHCYRNEIKEFRQAAERIEKLMTDYGYFGHLASLSFLKGVLCLKDLDRNDNLILKETACSQVVLNFTNALVNALKYNTHFLDSLLHKIINSLRPYETLALSNGNFLNQTIFKELTERWERETFDGYRLVVLERRKRSLEGGNGKNQLTILEIMQEKAFNGTYPNSM